MWDWGFGRQEPSSPGSSVHNGESAIVDESEVWRKERASARSRSGACSTGRSGAPTRSRRARAASRRCTMARARACRGDEAQVRHRLGAAGLRPETRFYGEDALRCSFEVLRAPVGWVEVCISLRGTSYRARCLNGTCTVAWCGFDAGVSRPTKTLWCPGRRHSSTRSCDAETPS